MGFDNTMEGNGNRYNLGREVAQYITSSKARLSIILYLDQDPKLKRTIRKKLDLHDSTLHRNLKTLTEKGWIQKNNAGEYKLTKSGRIVQTELEEHLSTLSLAEKLGKIENKVPIDKYGISKNSLSESDIIEIEGDNQHNIETMIVEMISSSDSFYGILPQYNPYIISELLSQIREQKIEGFLSINRDQIEYIKRNHKNELTTGMKAENFEFYHSQNNNHIVATTDRLCILGGYDGRALDLIVKITDNNIRSSISEKLSKEIERKHEAIDQPVA